MLRIGLVCLCFAIAACGTDTTGGTDGGDGGTDAGPSDAGNSDAGVDAGPATAIQAPSDQWTWVPFGDAFCGNGSTVGLGVNLSPASSKVLLYLEGGGACWNATTCYTVMSAANFTTGYSQQQFAAEAASTTYLAQPGGFFDRSASTNPFKDYNFVYIPYCTGDVHAGSNVATYGSSQAHHVGYQNMAAFLRRLVPTFATATRIDLAGSSAGGFGALINWGQVQRAFGTIRVDMIDDSGTFLPTDIVPSSNPTVTAWRSSWNLAQSLPAGCATCSTDLSALYGYYAQLYPTHRGALLSYAQDSVLPIELNITTTKFTQGLNEDAAAFVQHTNLAAFTYGGSGQVLFFQPTLTTNGTSVQTFLSKMVTDDASWGSESP